jgi:hypothetical protein
MHGANPAHDRFDNGHVGGSLAALDQLLLQMGDGGVFGAASRAGFQVCPALKSLLGIE